MVLGGGRYTAKRHVGMGLQHRVRDHTAKLGTFRSIGLECVLDGFDEPRFDPQMT